MSTTRAHWLIHDWFSALLGMLALLQVACGGGSDVTTPLPPSPTPRELRILSGDGQRVQIGAALTDPLRVSVIGSDELPVEGETVHWSVVEGAATLNPLQGRTDAAGEAETRVTIGGSAGTIMVRAAVDQLAPVNFSVTVTSPPAPPGSAQLATGNRHTCRLVGETLWCWGHNDSGQLGDGTIVDRHTAASVAGDMSFAAVSAGGSHTCGITTEGSTYCWGSNSKGQLGDGTLVDQAKPKQVAPDLTFVEVNAGGSHTCGLTASREAYCWGWNSRGQLGDGTTDDRHTPTPVSGEISFVTLSVGDAASEAGGEFSCGVTFSGATFCWGRNFSGQLGDGTGITQLTPVRVLETVGFTLVRGGGSHACALAGDTRAFCWGTYGLGNGSQSTELRPMGVAGGLTFLSISAGGHHTCGVDNRGVICWGHNDFGQLGDGTSTEQLSPVRVPTSETIAEVSAGGKHSCGATATGETYCWGSNEYGQLGDGSTIDRLAPTLVSLPLCCQTSTHAMARRQAHLCACALD
jgi:alpha-tubulin suppressor-like RCC1 family protein